MAQAPLRDLLKYTFGGLTDTLEVLRPTKNTKYKDGLTFNIAFAFIRPKIHSDDFTRVTRQEIEDFGLQFKEELNAFVQSGKYKNLPPVGKPRREVVQEVVETPISSQQFINIHTGEIVTQIPIMQIADYEPYVGQTYGTQEPEIEVEDSGNVPFYKKATNTFKRMVQTHLGTSVSEYKTHNYGTFYKADSTSGCTIGFIDNAPGTNILFSLNPTKRKMNSKKVFRLLGDYGIEKDGEPFVVFIRTRQNIFAYIGKGWGAEVEFCGYGVDIDTGLAPFDLIKNISAVDTSLVGTNITKSSNQDLYLDTGYEYRLEAEGLAVIAEIEGAGGKAYTKALGESTRGTSPENYTHTQKELHKDLYELYIQGIRLGFAGGNIDPSQVVNVTLPIDDMDDYDVDGMESLIQEILNEPEEFTVLEIFKAILFTFPSVFMRSRKQTNFSAVDYAGKIVDLIAKYPAFFNVKITFFLEKSDPNYMAIIGSQDMIDTLESQYATVQRLLRENAEYEEIEEVIRPSLVDTFNRLVSEKGLAYSNKNNALHTALRFDLVLPFIDKVMDEDDRPTTGNPLLDFINGIIEMTSDQFNTTQVMFALEVYSNHPDKQLMLYNREDMMNVKSITEYIFNYQSYLNLNHSIEPSQYVSALADVYYSNALNQAREELSWQFKAMTTLQDNVGSKNDTIKVIVAYLNSINRYPNTDFYAVNTTSELDTFEIFIKGEIVDGLSDELTFIIDPINNTFSIQSESGSVFRATIAYMDTSVANGSMTCFDFYQVARQGVGIYQNIAKGAYQPEPPKSTAPKYRTQVIGSGKLVYAVPQDENVGRIGFTAQQQASRDNYRNYEIKVLLNQPSWDLDYEHSIDCNEPISEELNNKRGLPRKVRSGDYWIVVDVPQTDGSWRTFAIAGTGYKDKSDTDYPNEFAIRVGSRLYPNKVDTDDFYDPKRQLQAYRLQKGSPQVPPSFYLYEKNNSNGDFVELFSVEENNAFQQPFGSDEIADLLRYIPNIQIGQQIYAIPKDWESGGKNTGEKLCFTNDVAEDRRPSSTVEPTSTVETPADTGETVLDLTFSDDDFPSIRSKKFKKINEIQPYFEKNMVVDAFCSKLNDLFDCSGYQWCLEQPIKKSLSGKYTRSSYTFGLGSTSSSPNDQTLEVAFEFTSQAKDFRVKIGRVNRNGNFKTFSNKEVGSTQTSSLFQFNVAWNEYKDQIKGGTITPKGIIADVYAKVLEWTLGNQYVMGKIQEFCKLRYDDVTVVVNKQEMVDMFIIELLKAFNSLKNVLKNDPSRVANNAQFRSDLANIYLYLQLPEDLAFIESAEINDVGRETASDFGIDWDEPDWYDKLQEYIETYNEEDRFGYADFLDQYSLFQRAKPIAHDMSSEWEIIAPPIVPINEFNKDIIALGMREIVFFYIYPMGHHSEVYRQHGRDAIIDLKKPQPLCCGDRGKNQGVGWRT